MQNGHIRSPEFPMPPSEEVRNRYGYKRNVSKRAGGGVKEVCGDVGCQIGKKPEKKGHRGRRPVAAKPLRKKGYSSQNCKEGTQDWQDRKALESGAPYGAEKQKTKRRD